MINSRFYAPVLVETAHSEEQSRPGARRDGNPQRSTEAGTEQKPDAAERCKVRSFRSTLHLRGLFVHISVVTLLCDTVLWLIY